MSEPLALKRGRERARAMRRREAIKRVVAFRHWLKAGSPEGQCPPLPSSADFRVWRGERG